MVMTEDELNTLKYLRERANILLKAVALYCLAGAWLTSERDQTADYIWGNCTLEELLTHLEEEKP